MQLSDSLSRKCPIIEDICVLKISSTNCQLRLVCLSSFLIQFFPLWGRIIGWAKSFAIFWYHDAHFGCFGCFWRVFYRPTTLDCEMRRSPDTRQVLFDWFTLITWRMTLESMVLGLSDHCGFCNPNLISSTILIIVLGSTGPSPWGTYLLYCFGSVVVALFELIKHKSSN